MKIVKYLLTVLIFTFFTLNICTTSTSYAKNLTDIFNGGDEFIEAGKGSSLFNKDTVKENTKNLYNMGLGIGVALAIIIGTILGIQFIMASAEGQAKIKEKMIPYCIGCVVVFGAFGIWKLVLIVIQDTLN